MKKCLRCGYEGESNFCPECGGSMTKMESISSENANASRPQQSQPQSQPQSQQSAVQNDSSTSYTYKTEPKNTKENIKNKTASNNNDSPQGNSSVYTYSPGGNNTSSDNSGRNDSTGYRIPNQQPKQGVSSKTWFVVLFLIIFWPVGIYLMWSRKKFSKAARVIITIVIGLFVALSITVNIAAYKYASDTMSYDRDYSFELENDKETESSPAVDSSSATTGQENALERAYDYLDTMPFSHDGLIEQLKFEGFSSEDATYAADHCGADWNKQAEETAKDYMDVSSFSRERLIDQLIYEGFTQEQAEHGVKAVGY